VQSAGASSEILPQRQMERKIRRTISTSLVESGQRRPKGRKGKRHEYQ
jgi:hypothetical protein